MLLGHDRCNEQASIQFNHNMRAIQSATSQACSLKLRRAFAHNFVALLTATTQHHQVQRSPYKLTALRPRTPTLISACHPASWLPGSHAVSSFPIRPKCLRTYTLSSTISHAPDAPPSLKGWPYRQQFLASHSLKKRCSHYC